MYGPVATISILWFSIAGFWFLLSFCESEKPIDEVLHLFVSTAVVYVNVGMYYYAPLMWMILVNVAIAIPYITWRRCVWAKKMQESIDLALY
jgi:hypothetical protein